MHKRNPSAILTVVSLLSISLSLPFQPRQAPSVSVVNVDGSSPTSSAGDRTVTQTATQTVTTIDKPTLTTTIAVDEGSLTTTVVMTIGAGFAPAITNPPAPGSTLLTYPSGKNATRLTPTYSNTTSIPHYYGGGKNSTHHKPCNCSFSPSTSPTSTLSANPPPQYPTLAPTHGQGVYPKQYSHSTPCPTQAGLPSGMTAPLPKMPKPTHGVMNKTQIPKEVLRGPVGK